MKLFQFDLFSRVFSRKRYRTIVLKRRLSPYICKIYIRNKALVITEHFAFRLHRVYVYNGMRYKRCKISEIRVGHRFGEFIRTKKQSRLIHQSKHNDKKDKKVYMKAHGMLKKQRRTKK